MLQVQDLRYSVEERELLKGVNCTIRASRRSALIGPNGAGKTTLFRILTGELRAHAGSIVHPKNYRIGYLPQEEISIKGESVFSTAMEGRQDILSLEREMAEIHQALDSSRDDQEGLLSRLGELEQKYRALDGYLLESKTKSILSGLGFSEGEIQKPLSDFSGGWRMRAYLARLLVQAPDLLLLDEPTNHLDLPSLEWLEQYLLSFSGSMVLVSHDRYFIDRLAQDIYELDRGDLEYYPGDYHFYERKKEQKAALLQKKFETQQAEIKRQEKFIQRFRYKATKAAQVQSRIKQLEKMERIILPPSSRRLGFSLKVGQSSYKDVLEIENMSFRYDEDWVLEDLDLQVSRGDTIALVGVNGAGKTTLTRLVAGQLSPQKGKIQLGKRTRVGYYAQHQVASLNLSATIYDEVAATVSNESIPRIRDVLGIFQFSGDEVFKKISVLSGGEKARVSLTKILLSPINFLIMDEPTNHLDMNSRAAIENALQEFDGTLLVISHDRYFLDKLVYRVVELKGKRLIEYTGNYSYYLEKREDQVNVERPRKKDKSTAVLGRKTKEQKRKEAEARQVISKERNRLEGSILELEQDIDQLESRKNAVESELCRPEVLRDGIQVVSLQKELAEITKKLQVCYADWEKDKAKLENLLKRKSS